VLPGMIVISGFVNVNRSIISLNIASSVVLKLSVFLFNRGSANV